MRVCLIAEGCYPYITGGVSSWIQMLIKNFPEYEFIVIAISAKKDEALTPKYELPQNVRKVIDIYLESDMKNQVSNNKKVKIHFNEKEKAQIYHFLAGDKFDWATLLNCLNRYKNYTTVDFLTSQEFIEIVMKVSNERYPHISFNHFFWTIRSMMIPFLEVIKFDIPKADIYHSVSTGYAGVLGAIGKIKHNGKFLLTEHGIYTREREEEIIKADWVKGYFKDNWIKYFYSLSDCAYSYADQVISLFEKSRQLQLELGCDKSKTKVIPNGVDYQRFELVNNPMNKEQTDKIVLGAIVRVVPIKDIKTLIQSFSIVKSKDLDFEIELHIIGPTEEDPDYMRECEHLIESLELQDVLFTGKVDISQYIHQLDIIILSSISEGQPLSTLEAMAAKKPCICTDVGSCKELLYGNQDQLGECGIIVPVMGHEEMANAIINLASDSEKRRKLGEIGYQRVLKFYRQEQFITNYKILYKELVG